MKCLTAVKLLCLTACLMSVFAVTWQTRDFVRSTVENTNHTAASVRRHLGTKILNYTSSNGFTASQTGILIGSKLVYAEGTGSLDQSTVQADTLIPILDLSKAITAVAILQLVEDGSIELSEKVFCSGCLMDDYLGTDNTSVRDSRIHNITIEHLLLHKAGWDEMNSAVLDPMINPLLLSLKYNVPNIRAETASDAEGYYDQYTIIEYMLRRQLDFTPGTKVVHSNLGYSILGRVVEAVTGEEYQTYVKKNILEPSGMYHTEIGTSTTQLTDLIKQKYRHRRRHGHSVSNGEPSGQVSPLMLDSALGWYSNVYDVARFFIALFESNTEVLLRTSTVRSAVSNIPELALYHQYAWNGLRLNIPNRRALQKERLTKNRHVSVFFYREPGFELSSTSTPQVSDIKTYIFIGITRRHRNRINGVGSDILNVHINSLRENMFMRDLGGMMFTVNSQPAVLKTDVKGDDLVAYSSALKQVGLHPLWVHGYSHQQHSLYLVVFIKAILPHQLQYIMASSTSSTKVWKFVADHTSHNYQATFVQSFVNPENKLEHLVIMRRPPPPKVIMFGFHKTHRFYNHTLTYAMAEGFQPVIQSIQKRAGRKYVSFLLQKPHALTKHYSDLPLEQLTNITVNNSNIGYYMSHIDVRQSSRGPPLFSAIFTHKTTPPTWMLQTNITEQQLTTECQSKASLGYLPVFILPYRGHHQSVKYVVHWQRHG